ncbi:hypothetical protein K470DRAFT_275234 [Piedraia hortae CBS 480.64]|uniref:Uncharacterized protein n=1 Tax=Piedraia hortae CBS 480.64 TaxID=1314780 RepID=A0A6A7C5I2_9PEZI|nr:hypothetical protein K470DRAFT_275234 [Piedraia hortae CBS 480.64]
MSHIAALFRRAPAQAPRIQVPFNVFSNPYNCKRSWPPDFEKLSQKHQFRLERRYRRRTKLKWARPTWVKALKLTQWGSVLFVLVYGVLYMDMDTKGEPTPFDGIRRWYREEVVDQRVQGSEAS